MGSASKISLQAAVSIGDTPEIPAAGSAQYTEGDAEHPCGRVFKSIHPALRDKRPEDRLRQVGEEDCDAADVRQMCGHTASLCDQPVSGLLRDAGAASCPFQHERRALENGTQGGGPIIHELSHFDIVAGPPTTFCHDDALCCAQLRRVRRRDPVRNADSYQYFAEDIASLRASRLVGRRRACVWVSAEDHLLRSGLWWFSRGPASSFPHLLDPAGEEVGRVVECARHGTV